MNILQNKVKSYIEYLQNSLSLINKEGNNQHIKTITLHNQ